MTTENKKQMLAALALLQQACGEMPAQGVGADLGNQMAELCAELSCMVEDEETD